MAGFQTHVTAGLITGAVLGTLSYSSGWTEGAAVPAGIFTAAAVGSFLPDLDSDTGLPLRILFYVLGIAGGTAVFLREFSDRGALTSSLVYALATALVIRFLFIRLFMKFTEHRGMFHSLPALFISGLLMLYITGFTDLETMSRLLLAVSAALGFLSHLLLDEFYGTMNIIGRPFRGRADLGGTLKIYGSSAAANVITYLILTALIAVNSDILKIIFSLVK